MKSRPSKYSNPFIETSSKLLRRFLVSYSPRKVTVLLRGASSLEVTVLELGQHALAEENEELEYGRAIFFSIYLSIITFTFMSLK